MLLKHLNKKAVQNDGFSLLDLIVGVAIFTMTSAAIATLITINMRLQEQNAQFSKSQIKAANIVEEYYQTGDLSKFSMIDSNLEIQVNVPE